MPKQITLVRHGEVEEKYQHKYNGWIDIGLSSKGKKQIQKVAKDLGKIDHLYSSDLRRCRESLPFFDAEKITVSKQLREKWWGVYEGKSFDEIIASGIEYHTFPQFIDDLGGESIDNFQKRVITIWQRIKKCTDNRVVLLVHGGVIHQIIAFEKQITLQESYTNYTIRYGETFTIEEEKKTQSPPTLKKLECCIHRKSI